jgi:hypothetical protein
MSILEVDIVDIVDISEDKEFMRGPTTTAHMRAHASALRAPCSSRTSPMSLYPEATIVTSCHAIDGAPAASQGTTQGGESLGVDDITIRILKV